MTNNKLTPEKIRKLASGKGVKTIAVENFLMSVGANKDAQDAFMNLSVDAQSYGWNGATRTAIAKGIGLYFGR